MYKLFSIFFFITTLIFAGLYFTVDNESNIKVDENIFLSENKISVPAFKPLDEKDKNSPKSKSFTERRPKVIIQEVSSHPEYDPDKIDDMAFMYEAFLKSHTKQIERSYPLLFERLNLDDTTKEELSSLLSEREMVSWMRSYNLTQEEKEVLKSRKEEMKMKFDEQIADLLGSEMDIFIDYESKKNQYQQISGLQKQMEENGEFSHAAQDELASLMLDSRNVHKEMFEDDWNVLRESKEKADEFLAVTSERYEQLKESAGLLNDAQKEVFSKYLAKIYRRYERAAQEYERRRKNEKK